MKILLVNNHTSHIKEILTACHGATVVDCEDLYSEAGQSDFYKEYDAIVLSGGSTHAVINHEEHYSKEMQLIKDSGKPNL